MAANISYPPMPPPPPSNLFASIDMGTNSFKLLIVRASPHGPFLPVLRVKHPVLLGLSGANTISNYSQIRALETLQKFKKILHNNHITPAHTRCVATAAVREAENKQELVETIREKVGFEVNVLSGVEEARNVYMGVLQCLPIHEKLVLTIDIGGGSTEFVIGKLGTVIFGTSLNLGHVNLTQKFVENGGGISEMREYVRSVIQESGLAEKVKECGFDVAVGSSGTIRSIEKSVFHGYTRKVFVDMSLSGESDRNWMFSRGELRCLVEKLCGGGDEERVKREGFFKRRAEFIVAGAVLLEEIFEVLGIEEMEVSGYGLGEGVISNMLGEVYGGYDLNANARWRSVVSLAMRFNSKKSMRAATQCACIAKEIFEGLKKCDEYADNQFKLPVSLDDKDLEYLEAACLLHGAGLFTGKKGYHKQSYRIIMNGDHLHGYNIQEVKLIALLAKHHRKKYPKLHHASFEEFSEDVKAKFRILCAIIRISVVLQQYQSVNFWGVEFSHSREGFKLVFSEASNEPLLPADIHPLTENIDAELRQELEYFKTVFQQELSVVVPLSNSDNAREIY